MANDLPALLQQAAAGLRYQSETDAPFEVVHWPDCTQAPSPAEVLARAGRAPDTRVSVESVDAFFARLTAERDWYGAEERETARGYRELQALVQQHLPEAQVFHVGAVEIDVYLLGLAADDGCVGLKTSAVET